ncbi:MULTISPECIES: helix-turn-helix transcriptional regulator [unclassified Psychrobacter]|uniref:helix-turn-helix transcriptional regulator n=1 Tax=unclassified Psychrobacter TaxID=196806 RepID=UPI001D187B3D|nr:MULTISPECIES: AlpA family phage regulatory protein [unclassified Psychrobacter]
MTHLHAHQPAPVIPFTGNAPTDNQPVTAHSEAIQMPLTGMGRAKDILPFLPFSKTTLFEWSKDGRFPAPVKLSPTMTAWRYADVHNWLNNLATSSEV